MTGKNNRKEQILALATEMFSRDGYDMVTVKQLADGCGITEPAIYRHFESKEAIYGEVLEALRGRMDHHELFARLEKENDLEVLVTDLSLHIVSFYSTNADIYRLLLYAALRGHARAGRIYELIRGTYCHFLQKQLDRLYEQGSIVAVHSEITARCFVGMVFDCAMASSLWRGFQGPVYDPKEVLANSVRIFVKGMTP